MYRRAVSTTRPILATEPRSTFGAQAQLVVGFYLSLCGRRPLLGVASGVVVGASGYAPNSCAEATVAGDATASRNFAGPVANVGDGSRASTVSSLVRDAVARGRAGVGDNARGV